MALFKEKGLNMLLSYTGWAKKPDLFER